MSLNALKQAQTRSAFVEAARAIVSESREIAYNADKIDATIETARSYRPGTWDWQDAFANETIAQAFFKTTLNAGLNGGYFYRDADGSVRQWEKGGSGSAALAEWLKNLGAECELPGINLKTRAAAKLVLAPAVTGLPYAEQRLEFLSDCADDGFRTALDAVLGDATKEEAIHFELRHAQALAAMSPAGFGADPFLKKAILALQLTASHAIARKLKATCDLPIPSDYQIPRVLTWLGVIGVSEAFAAALRAGELLNVESDVVTAFRAAAIVACADIGAAAGVEDRIVDELLFTVYRPNPDFKRTSLPAMRCEGMWF